MQEFRGRKIFDGIAVGRIFFYSREQKKVVRRRITDAEAELARFEEAKRTARGQLETLYDKALKQINRRDAQIFHTHLLMLDDYDLNDAIVNMVKNRRVNAEYAVAITGDNFAARFENMEDEYFKSRSIDIRDVTERILDALMGGENDIALDAQSIIAAADLTPSETLQMDKEKVLAFVTDKGSANSHTAILARALNVPAVAGIKASGEWNEKMAIIDGYEALFILEPDEETLEKYRKKQEDEKARIRLLDEYKGRKTVTKNKKRIDLYANAGSLDDIDAAVRNDAEGIGLFRTEFIFLESESEPTEEQQFDIYMHAARKMAGKKVIIRTLDIGADKQPSYTDMEKEANPAMGCRGVRLCLTRTEMFKTQLRAIFRACAYGNIAIMYPMITSVDEVRAVKRIAEEVKEELRQSSITYGEAEQGIMIETPAAALISDMLAKEADFFSIGTNDLAQYTLAMDRQNSELEKFFDPHHEALMRLIKMTVKNAHDRGIWVGICGELAADTSLTRKLINMGVDELSVAAGMVLPIRKETAMCEYTPD